MNIKPIKTPHDHEAALARINELFDAELNTPEGDELEVLITLVHAYEEEHFKIEAPDPIEAIKFRMEQQGMTDRDLVPFLGQRGRVSEILNKKRGLSLNMIRKLHEGLNIPFDSLMSKYKLESEQVNHA